MGGAPAHSFFEQDPPDLAPLNLDLGDTYLYANYCEYGTCTEKTIDYQQCVNTCNLPHCSTFCDWSNYTRATIEINNSSVCAGQSGSTYYYCFRGTATHELGHAFGLSHNPCTTDSIVTTSQPYDVFQPDLGSRRVPLDPVVENNAPPPTPNAIAAQKLAQVPTVAPATPGPTPADVAPLETTYLIQVISVLHGSLQEGNQLRVIQRGGHDSQGTEVVEGNPQLVVGDQEIMFLGSGDGGTYFVRGGPEGRFGVTGGTVVARGPDTPVGRAYDHKPLAGFIAAVRAAAAP